MDRQVIALMIPIVAILCTMGLPMLIAIVAIMTGHQRKMAELMRSGMDNQSGQAVGHLMSEVQALRGQVAQMQDRLNQMTLMLDARPNAPALPVSAEEVEPCTR